MAFKTNEHKEEQQKQGLIRTQYYILVIPHFYFPILTQYKQNVSAESLFCAHNYNFTYLLRSTHRRDVVECKSAQEWFIIT